MKAMEISYPSIKINKKIYIPMIDQKITRENICNLKTFEDNRNYQCDRKKINIALRNERIKTISENGFEDLIYHPIFNNRKESYNEE